MALSTIPCSECGAPNLGTAVICARCGAALPSGEGATADERAVPAALGEAGGGASGGPADEKSDARGSESAGREDEEGASLRSAFDLGGTSGRRERPRPEGTKTAGAEGPFAERAAASARTAPGSREAAGMPPHDRSTQSTPRQRAESDELSLDPNQIEAITNYGKGRRIISVIGFPNSGKTFLVNRLRHLAMHRGDWKAHPSPAERIPLSPEGVELTHLVAARNGWARRHRSYVVMDCAGESFMTAFERMDRDRELQGVATRSYLAAAGLASAYILVLRAQDVVTDQAETLDDTKWKRRTADLAGRFYDIVGGILVARERLRRQGPEALLERGISHEEMGEIFHRNVRCPTPLCVLFAQADRVEDRLSNATGFDHDPYRFAQRHTTMLFQAVRNSFSHYRFEFVSSFHDYRSEEGPAPRAAYELPSYGVADIFDWIDRLVAPRPPLVGPLLRALDGGVPTEWAVRLRRWADADFRRSDA